MCNAAFYRSKTVVSLIVLQLSCLLFPAAFASEWQYTVRPGDTMWSVCREYTAYSNCWRELGPYNGVVKPRSLAVGEQLKVPIAWLKLPPLAATVIYVRGDVQLSSNGEARHISEDQSLNLGDRISTKEGSVTLQFADGSLLLMSAESEITLDAVSAFKQTKSLNVDVSLPYGEVSIKVPKRKPRSSFKVHTPSAVAAVRGTEFRVNVNDDSAQTRGEVLSGQIGLADGTSETKIDAGQGALAEQGQTVSAVVQLLAAPEWNLSCTDPGYTEWQSLPAADYYRLALLEDDVSADKLLSTMVVTRNHFTFKNIKEKCYQLKVSAVDAQGFNGLESRRQFCYELQLEPPVIQTLAWVNDELAIRWNRAQFAEAYLVEISDTDDFSEVLLAETVSADQLDKALSRLSQNVHVRVASLSGDRQSDFTSPIELEHQSQRSWLVGIIAVVAAFAIL